MQKVQTVTFAHSDKPVAKELGTAPEPTYWTGGATDTPLGEYFRRPVRLASYTWALNANLFETIRPWQEWRNDTNVRPRLEGFKHFRGKLRVRAVINGNPMFYGKLIMAWEPRAQRSIFPIASSTSNACTVQLTCMPHVILDACTGEGGELQLPFFCPENWLDTTNSISAFDMGTLHLHSIAPLRTAGATGTQTIEIQLYAWLEDAEVCTPTATNYDQWSYQGSYPEPDAVTVTFWQALARILRRKKRKRLRRLGDEIPQNEFATGMVSKPATAVAKAAKMLAKVPVIEPYALATEIVASGLAGVAHVFGFSRPQVMDNISRYRQFYAGELATTNTHDAFAKLALDAKNQLTIDPRTVGLSPVDEMSIPYIVQKEAYTGKFTWDVADTTDTVLQRINVTPVMFNRDTTTVTPRAALTPLAFASFPFRYWRGSIIFRFQIIASAFHRGRIRIAYEPAGSSSQPGFNQVYSTIVDIATNRDVELPVEWHAHQPWLDVHKPNITSTTDTPFGTTIPMSPVTDNGQLTISVVNKLQAPDPTNTQGVTIAMYVRGGDDLEFAVPWDLDGEYTFRAPDPGEQPQSLSLGEVPQNAFEQDQQEEEDNMPEGGKPLGGVGDYHQSPKNELSKVYFGEHISSFRTLLKRYQQGPSVTNLSFNYYRSNVSQLNSPMREFIMVAYAGWRGSIRYKLLPGTTSSRNTVNHSFGGEGFNSNTMQGVHINYGPVEFESPWYSTKRFEHCRTSPHFTADTDELARQEANPNRQGFFYTGDSGLSFSAIGEDFTTFFFIGPPLIYSTAD
ncbi:hypothetical protein 2 [Beihai picorna-like virus 19]|uniref:hypothetical protein 2 n=1 Tax=Beihai picorna-like virus 19 TaxID=1922561 RepID=UPI00090CA058|nr:hypothetical protein 2 [Beihai picorna-like virus 19]APG76786.1 hypothetical protein 2 [Beihai picorna-like virus 19]